MVKLAIAFNLEIDAHAIVAYTTTAYFQWEHWKNDPYTYTVIEATFHYLFTRNFYFKILFWESGSENKMDMNIHGHTGVTYCYTYVAAASKVNSTLHAELPLSNF